MSELDQYDYQLPRELIAQHPLARRSDARLMVVRRAEQSIDHAHVRDLPEILTAERLPGLQRYARSFRPGWSAAATARAPAGRGLFLAADEHGVWQVLSKTRGKLEPGEAIIVVSWDVRQTVTLRLLAKLDGGVWAVRPEPLGEPLEILQPRRPRAAAAVYSRRRDGRRGRRDSIRPSLPSSPAPSPRRPPGCTSRRSCSPS